MQDFQPKRLKALCDNIIKYFLLGVVYYIFIKLTGWRIPCTSMMLFNKLCPGCGTTRMCVAMIEGDFALAFRQNQAVFVLLPFMFAWGMYKAYKYVFNKKPGLFLWEKIMLIVVILGLFLFAILRNLPGFEFLAPIPWEEL